MTPVSALCLHSPGAEEGVRAGRLGPWIVMLVVAIAACRQGVPVVDTSPRPPTVDGTISGTVTGPGGTPLEGRIVEVTNLETGQRQRLTTSNSGGFTFKVPPGRYQVDLTLRDGESLTKRPGIMSINRSDVDAHADFVVGVARTVRPHRPLQRGFDGLGPASA